MRRDVGHVGPREGLLVGRIELAAVLAHKERLGVGRHADGSLVERSLCDNTHTTHNKLGECPCACAGSVDGGGTSLVGKTVATAGW